MNAGTLHRPEREPVAWGQSQLNTCGPSCLMVALCELGLSDLSRATEMEIWKRVRHARVLGSTPARLAGHALSRGVETRLLARSGPAPAVVPGRSPVQRLLHRYLFGVYSRTARDYRLRGLPFGEYREAADIPGLLPPDMAAHAILLISDQDEVLHFVLARRVRTDLVVMDPSFGTNTRYEDKPFLAEFGPRMAGYCVLMSL